MDLEIKRLIKAGITEYTDIYDVPEENGTHVTEHGEIDVKFGPNDVPGSHYSVTLGGPVVGKQVEIPLYAYGRGEKEVDDLRVRAYVEHANTEYDYSANMNRMLRKRGLEKKVRQPEPHPEW